jgi:hypothetical protein
MMVGERADADMVAGARRSGQYRQEQDRKDKAMRTSIRLAAAATLALSALPASAALAPNYQRLAELRAVLGHPGVAAAFGVSEPIDRIEYAGPDLYRVTAGRCHVDVRIVSLPVPNGMVGPRRFEARAGQRVCGR